MSSLFWRLRGERMLFRSRKSRIQAPQWAVGEIVEQGGAMFVVTRWIELPPTHNARGGAIPEWEVWGRAARAAEVSAAVANAAARILEEAGQRRAECDEGAPDPKDGSPRG